MKTRRAGLVIAGASVSALAGCPYDGRGFDSDARVDDGPVAIDMRIVDADPNAPDGMPDATPPPDGAPDADPCESWSPEHVDACVLPAPDAGWHLTAGVYTYNTSTGTLTPGPSPTSDVVSQRDGGAPQVRVISVDSFVMDSGARLNVTGARPLVIASWSTASVGGIIDAGSHIGGTSGPDVDPTGQCNPATQGGNGVSTGGSGGGGGGGMRGGGGDGGQGDSPPGPLGGPGGAAVGTPTYVRGGCSGADSGTSGSGAQSPSNPSTVSPRGAGGGAVELIARVNIDVNGGQILAGGAGGGGAPNGSACGGGGGGGGGFVGLDAPTVTTTGAVLAANGGGGGASASFGSTGNPGTDGGANGTQAGGGPAQTCAPAGGDGGAGGTFGGDTSVGNLSCGGGGGGGAAGFVMVWSPTWSTSSSTISPTVIVTP